MLHDVRTLVRNQIYLLVLGCILALVTGLSSWAMAFAAGCALVTMNFWFLAKSLQSVVHRQEGAVVVSLAQFYGRLLLTGLALFGLIAWGGLPVPALVAGLSTVVVNILFWGVFRFYRQKVKEA
ncbi:ATP synthase subunit I [Desulfonatronum sp. SC1]|uniref:ATP synthase subunit I n=1 Tax=Desulfonatronum sp. SC1 TaxID=2109626 RepID=UPI001E416238|nr:ATP synthase subunit I [Desulfonatronum sp. SC1]